MEIIKNKNNKPQFFLTCKICFDTEDCTKKAPIIIIKPINEMPAIWRTAGLKKEWEIPKPDTRKEYKRLVKKRYETKKYQGVSTPMKVISHSATFGGLVMSNVRIMNAAKAIDGR